MTHSIHLAAALTALSRLRRYGPDEDDVAWRLAAAVNRPRPVSQPALWVWERLHEAAVWLTLIHGKADAARRYLDRCPAVAETWLGWLATGRRDSPLALRARHGSWTLWRQAELSHAVTAPLRHDRGEPDAVAWWRAETAGWDLVLSPPEQWPQRLRETGPAILSGAPTR